MNKFLGQTHLREGIYKEMWAAAKNNTPLPPSLVIALSYCIEGENGTLKRVSSDYAIEAAYGQVRRDVPKEEVQTEADKEFINTVKKAYSVIDEQLPVAIKFKVEDEQ